MVRWDVSRERAEIFETLRLSSFRFFVSFTSPDVSEVSVYSRNTPQLMIYVLGFPSWTGYYFQIVAISGPDYLLCRSVLITEHSSGCSEHITFPQPLEKLFEL